MSFEMVMVRDIMYPINHIDSPVVMYTTVLLSIILQFQLINKVKDKSTNICQ